MSKGSRKKTALEPVSLSRRFFAYLIDWYVGALATTLPVSVVASKLFGDMTKQNIVEFTAPWGIVAGLAALVFAFAYYVLIPRFVWRGQTPAKRLLGVKIVRSDGDDVDFAHLLLRQAVGVFLIEGSLIKASAYLHQILTIVSGFNFVTPLMYVGFALTLVSVATLILRGDRRCIHDLVGDTRVIRVEA